MSTTISFLSDGNIQLHRLLLFYKKKFCKHETWRRSFKNHHPIEQELSLLSLPYTLLNPDDLDLKNLLNEERKTD